MTPDITLRMNSCCVFTLQSKKNTFTNSISISLCVQCEFCQSISHTKLFIFSHFIVLYRRKKLLKYLSVLILRWLKKETYRQITTRIWEKKILHTHSLTANIYYMTRPIEKRNEQEEDWSSRRKRKKTFTEKIKEIEKNFLNCLKLYGNGLDIVAHLI